MARQVLPIVGGIVGAFFGNPQLGWAIGAAIGNAVDPLTIKGPSLGEIAQQTSSEGGPRPYFFGLSPPVAGNVIATGEPRIVKKKKKTGKSGPKVETESVYRTYAIGVGETIGGFVRVWRNSTLVYDVSENSLLSDEENASFLEHARFFLGTFDQNPSPDLEAIFGVGTTASHRGTAYMVMADEDLTNLGGAIPQWMFQVQRCGVAQPVVLAISSSSTNASHQVLRSTDGENFVGVETPVNGLSSPFGWRGLAHSPALGLVVACAQDGDFMVSEDAGATWEHIDPIVGVSGWTAVARSDELGLFAAVRAHATHAIATSPDGRNWTLHSTPALNGQCIIANGSRFIAGGIGSANNILTSDNGTAWTARILAANVYELAAKGSEIVGVDRGGTSLRRSLDNGSTWFVGGTIFPFGVGDIAYRADPDAPGGLCVSIFGAAYATGVTDFNVLSNPGGELWEGVCHSATFGGFYLASGPGSSTDFRIGKLPDGFTDGVIKIAVDPSMSQASYDKIIAIDAAAAGTCVISVAEIIDALCERVGMPAGTFDTSELEADECSGLAATNQYPASETIRALAQVFFFDPSNYDGAVHFVKRGGNSLATVTEDDMVDDEAEIEHEKRADAITIPRVLHLLYTDVDGGLAPNKQTSERAGDRRALGEQSLQSPVVMTADQAARAVVINHKVMAEAQGGELKFQLPDSFLERVPADPIIVQWQGHSVRAMIQRADTFDGYQEYVAVRDRQSAYVSNIEGIPPPPQSAPPSNLVGPTLIEILDIHILRDADDGVGLLYYVAVSGALEAWQGAEVELSYDGGANYVDAQSTSINAIMGSLLTVLPDHPQAFPDVTNTVRVQIQSPNEELFGTTLAGLLNRQNLAIIGDEIIQFAEAEEVYEGVWDLSYLSRGRKGTTTAQHEIGARFVFLDRDSLAMVPASLVDIGRTLTFRATSFGTTADTGTVKSIVYAGRAQIEREVGYLIARRDGSNAIVEWQGVGRLGAGAQVAHGERFDGYRVTFDDGTNPEVVVDVDVETVTQDVSGLGSPITIAVVQLNTLTGEGPSTEVVLL